MSVADVERLLAAHRQETRIQLQQALKAMHSSAVRLLRQVAAEVWRGTGPGGDDRLRDGILRSLARDDALRALLAQVDERNQALSVRIDRMEGAFRRLVAANREAVRSSGGGATPAILERLAALEAALLEAISEDRRDLRTLASALRQAHQAHARDLAAVRSTGDEARAEQARATAALGSGLEEIRAEQARSGETVRAAVEEASDAERRQMTAFTVRVGEGLAQVSAKLHDSITHTAAAQREAAAAAGAALEASITRAVERSLERQGHRQEQLLDRRLAGLQAAIDALGRVAKDHAPSPGRPGAAQRLRTLEQRLSRVSGELAALEPLPQGSGG